MFSSEKVEKVVYPPQKPIINRYFSSLFRIWYLVDRPISNPMIKHPITLIINVAIGNDVV